MFKKTPFFKMKKEVPQKKMGGPGGKAPRQAGKVPEAGQYKLLDHV